MNVIDIVLIVPLLYAAWTGFKKGFIIELFTLLALLVGIYCGIHFSDWTAEKIKDGLTIDGKYLSVIAFTITFLGVGAMVYFAGKMLERMIKVVNLSPLNKFLGIIFSLLKMIYTISILIILIETYDERGSFIPTETKDSSYLYYPVKTIASATIPAIKESSIWLKNNVKEGLLTDPSTLNLKELKEKADSLGITTEDLMRIHKENSNKE